MKQHIVRQGENVHSIAQKYLSSVSKIWEDGQNSKLREARRSPDCLLPGDVLVIPENQDWFEGLQTDQTHNFEVELPEETVLKVQFRHNGKVLSSCKYELKFGEDQTRNGSTDDNGTIEEKFPIDVAEVSITFPDSGKAYRFGLRHLDPVESPSGIQSRLRALGLYFGKVDGVPGEKQEAAINRYKNKHGLFSSDEAGVIDHLYKLYDELSDDS